MIGTVQLITNRFISKIKTIARSEQMNEMGLIEPGTSQSYFAENLDFIKSKISFTCDRY